MQTKKGRMHIYESESGSFRYVRERKGVTNLCWMIYSRYMAHKCCSKQKVKRGLWSPEEDERLANYMTYNGHACWSSVPRLAGLQRCGKSCRLRWINYLRPELKRGTFTAEEEQIIIDVHRMLGNRWSEIARHLPGRTDNEVKNYWNSCIKKKLVAHGLDPKTHTLFKTNAAALPENKLKRPNFKLHKSNSHISYTADQPYDAPGTRLPPHLPQKPAHRRHHHHDHAHINDDRQPRSLDTPDFDHIERSYMDDGVDAVGILERDGAQVSHSSSVGMMASVREDCFTNFGLELDLIDDVIRMDDLLWNSTFPT